MINFREVFNVRYGIFFVIFILAVFVLLLVVNNDLRTSFKIVGNILFFSGIVSVVIVLLSNILIDILVGDLYRLLVNIISDGIVNNLLYRGVVNIVLGFILKIIYKVIEKRNIFKNTL